MTTIYCDPNMPECWQRRELMYQASAHAERAMRDQEPPPAANHPPLVSIKLARVRIATHQFYRRWGANHPQPPMAA